MSRVIRVDAGVFAELQRQAVPLVDNPNDVLRRLLKLDQKKEKPMSTRTRVRSDSGRSINKRYNLGAKHALYHIDGTFYERLEQFPGLLADPNGYVLYPTEEDFLNDAYLDVQDKVHVHDALARHPKYRTFAAKK